jgi:actin related protein 2/3 complex, subunit 1A/1B
MPEVDSTANSGPFATALPFGEVYSEFVSNGWTTAVAWGPSGSKLCFAGQDSSLTVVDFSTASETPVIVTVKYPLLPLECVQFVSEQAVVGGGFDMEPLLFVKDSKQGWYVCLIVLLHACNRAVYSK